VTEIGAPALACRSQTRSPIRSRSAGLAEQGSLHLARPLFAIKAQAGRRNGAGTRLALGGPEAI
jgi:hypothetical protein